jgi:hypothetical protein
VNQTDWIRLPQRVLPGPGRRELPEAPSLARMLGPSVILAGLSIGSGEFVLWPRLTAEWGFALFWACWIGVTLQFFLNMEIERYSLATGESAVVGFFRLARWLGPVFLVCSVVPWIWPGWATGAATLLSWEVGLPVQPGAIAGLLLCGVVLSLGPVVYRTVEAIQFALVTVIFVALLVLVFAFVRLEHVTALLCGALQVGRVPEGVHLPLLLGALAFAGAGGAVNLAQSNYIKDKGYGMGRWIGRITSPFTGREEAVSDIGFAFDANEENLRRWRRWWRRTNAEHFLGFFVPCLLSLALFALLAAALLPAGGPVSEGFGFIRDEAAEIERRFGVFGRRLFIATGLAVLLSTELALIDAISRVAADLLELSFLRERAVTLSQLYFAMVWTLIGFGVIVLLIGIDQPLFLLVLSASLNGVVMFLYSGLLLWLNLRSFRGPLRPGPVRVLALTGALLFFGYFSAVTLLDQVAQLF